MVDTFVNDKQPLKGCPKSWKEAYGWTDAANKNKEGVDVKWDFDCGYKLDYDGELIYVSSRFYPPKEHYGDTWDGTVRIYISGKKIVEKEFDCPSLDELRDEVESYIKSIAEKVQSAIEGII